MLFWYLILGFFSCLSTKLRLSDCESYKAPINVSNVSYKSCTRYAKTEEYLHEISMFTFTIFFPSIRNLCVQNQYTAVQTGLKQLCIYAL